LRQIPQMHLHRAIATQVADWRKSGYPCDYNFDSAPEAAFFEDLLAQLNLDPGEIADFHFTGALTSPKKTDLLVEYKDVDGRWRPYCPDFIIRRKDGRCLIIEIKRDDPALAEDEARISRGQEPATTEGRKALAMRRWENLNPDRLKYQLVRVADSLPPAATREAAAFARDK
jgi:type III restriction enzyme